MSKIRGNLFIKIFEGRDLINKDDSLFSSLRSLSDPWLEILIEDQQILSTPSIANTLNPKWNANAIVPLCYSQDFLFIKVWEDDLLGKTFLGESKISLTPVTEEWEKKEWVILNSGKGEVYIYLKFLPFIDPTTELDTEPLNADFLYFAPRKGGNIQLYQDAHVTSLPDLQTRILHTANHNAFEDMANAFENAQKLIYVAGWSVWTELEIKKDGKKETVGEILKRRSEAGVKVLVLLWNEKFSASLCQELFGTHVMKTLNYFKGSKVTAIAARRQPLNSKRVKEQFLDSIYTHHMKTIITDCPKNGLIGFVGGYDLTDGRWDTPEHPIWETLKNIHKYDFYNGFVTSLSSETGPREPWHDVHARVEGTVVLDLLRVFEERWKREVPRLSNLLIPFTELNISLIKSSNSSDIVWHSQILRSSNTDSTLFNGNLGGLIEFSQGQKDCSVHHGIISLIRSTKRFLYIESQYFIGSAFAWETEKDTCAQNLIPIEIAEQIIFSIKSGNPIRVYILIPLCPEGDSTSRIGGSYMSDILHWQFLTIQMMFTRIAKALRDLGIDAHPEEYLILLCLGKRQERSKSSKFFPSQGAPNSLASKWQSKSRFVVYVHSKMALADDARIVIGSANMNQRSLDGCRDTECSLAASQIKYSGPGFKTGKLVTDGAIADFRRCLWFEHSGGITEEEPVFADPSSRECITAIKEKALQSLFDYMDDKVDKDVSFRFMKYPLKISKEGKVEAFPEIPNIPDFGLSVLGKHGFIPKCVTT